MIKSRTPTWDFWEGCGFRLPMSGQTLSKESWGCIARSVSPLVELCCNGNKGRELVVAVLSEAKERGAIAETDIPASLLSEIQAGALKDRVHLLTWWNELDNLLWSFAASSYLP